MTQTIVEWFNPLDPDHVAIYRHLCEKGAFPATGMPPDLEMPNNWQVMLMSKIVEAWMRLFPKMPNGEKSESMLAFLIEGYEIGWGHIPQMVKEHEILCDDYEKIREANEAQE